MSEEDDLCTSTGEGCCDDGADAGGSSLGSFSWGIISAVASPTREEDMGRPTVIIMTFECSNRSERFTAPPK